MTFEILIMSVILPASFGGLIRGLVGFSKHNKKMNPLKLVANILIAMLVGGVAGVIVGGDWRISLLAGYAGADLIEGIYKSKLFSSLNIK